jgi:hypothetical protein
MTLTPTKADGIWLGLVLLALGALGFLDMAGVLQANETIGRWWPVAIIGWAAVGMLAARRVTMGGVIVAAVGFGLLADAQHWTLRVAAWSAVFSFIGVWILVSTLSGRRDGQRARSAEEDDRSSTTAART